MPRCYSTRHQQRRPHRHLAALPPTKAPIALFPRASRGGAVAWRTSLLRLWRQRLGAPSTLAMSRTLALRVAPEATLPQEAGRSTKSEKGGGGEDVAIRPRGDGVLHSRETHPFWRVRAYINIAPHVVLEMTAQGSKRRTKREDGEGGGDGVIHPRIRQGMAVGVEGTAQRGGGVHPVSGAQRQGRVA